MSKFNIIQSNPEAYKEQIIGFWKEYLPGTPPERLKWMQDNPAGPAIWFLAFEEENNQLAGTISITPRVIYRNNKIILAGIMGDFMTGSKYRLFGPAIELQKKAIQSIDKFGFKFIYTIPNTASIKLAQRVGFENVMKLHYLAKPICISYYLNKYLGKQFARLAIPIAELILKILSKETYLIERGIFEEISYVDKSLGAFWDKIICERSDMIGDYGPAFLRWKYDQNPSSKYILLTYKNKINGELLGFIVFSIEGKKMEVFDIFALSENATDMLLKKTILIARNDKCQAIYIRLSESNPLFGRLKYFGFVDSKTDVDILAYGESKNYYMKWSFFEGDRNI